MVRAQAVLEGAVERVTALVAASPELQALRRSCANAWGLYRRTRPGAAAESVARARALPPGGVHPLLAAAVPASALPSAEAQVRGACRPARVDTGACMLRWRMHARRVIIGSVPWVRGPGRALCSKACRGPGQESAACAGFSQLLAMPEC